MNCDINEKILFHLNVILDLVQDQKSSDIIDIIIHYITKCKRIIDQNYGFINPFRDKNNRLFTRVLNEIKINSTINSMKKRNLTKNQRSDEWKVIRMKKISASECHHCLGSEIKLYSYIYEKCKKYYEYIQSNNLQNIITSSLQHGIFNEYIIIEFSKTYLFRNYTVLHDFGTIEHESYTFIGASPDGLIFNANEIYLLEIKCPLTRELSKEIIKIPKEYLNQMQLQMEVCNINFCKYLEVLIVNYNDLSNFIEIYFEYLNHDKITKKYFGLIRSLNYSDQEIKKVHFFDEDIFSTNNTSDSIRNYILDILMIEISNDWTINSEETVYFSINDFYLETISRDQHWFENGIKNFQKCNNFLVKYMNNYDDYLMFESEIKEKRKKRNKKG